MNVSISCTGGLRPAHLSFHRFESPKKEHLLGRVLRSAGGSPLHSNGPRALVRPEDEPQTNRKGVCYDVGRVMMGGNWRPKLDPKTVHRELGIIKNDLHCNAVRICG